MMEWMEEKEIILKLGLEERREVKYKEMLDIKMHINCAGVSLWYKLRTSIQYSKLGHGGAVQL